MKYVVTTGERCSCVPAGKSYFCTEQKGHSGEHIAGWNGGNLEEFFKWPNENDKQKGGEKMKIVIQGSKEVVKKVEDIPGGTVFAGINADSASAVESIYFKVPCGDVQFLVRSDGSSADLSNSGPAPHLKNVKRYREVEVIFNVPAAG